MRQQTDTPSISRTAIAVIATAFATLMLIVAFTAQPAHALIDDGWQTVYTTEDLCELKLSPASATVNANGTQTFTVTFGTSEYMKSEFAEGGVPPRPQGELRDVPDTIDYDQVLNACVYGDVVNVVGLLIRFEVTSGPDAGKVFETELAADGTATFPLVNNGQLGTDQVKVTALLPQVCLYAMKDVGIGDPFQWELLSPEACEESLLPIDRSADSTASRVRPVDFGALPPVTITAGAAVTWIAPPPVAASGVVSVTSFKSCVSNRIRIRPRYTSGLRSSRLVVDGRTVARKTDTSAFIINPAKYKSGKHRFRVVATYDTGSVTSNTGTFTKCKAKVAQRRVAPRFTG